MSCCGRPIFLLLALKLALAGCHAPGPILQLSPRDGYALAAAFSSDGRWVAAGDARGTVRIWELPGGHMRAQREGFTPPGAMALRTIAFSPDGTRLAYATATGVELWTWQTDQASAFAGHAIPPHDLTFVADEKLVALSGGHDATPGAASATRQPLVVTTWDIRSGQLLTRAEDDTSGALNAAIAPDGKRFAMNCIEGTPRRFDQLTPTSPLHARLMLCDTATARILAAVDLEPEGGAWHMTFSPDGRWLFTSSLPGSHRGALRDARMARVVRDLDIGAAIFSSDGRKLISLHTESVGVFHPAMIIMPVASQRTDWRLVVVDLESGSRRSRRIKLREQHREGLEPLAFSADQSLLVDRALRIWKAPQP